VKAIIISAAVALIVTLLGTPIAIRLFRMWGWGQHIREDGPHTHRDKMGTPTMGGAVIIAGILAGYLVAHLARDATFSVAGLSLLFVACSLGLLGFVDDFLNARKERSLGLSKTAKIAGQAVVAALFTLIIIRGTTATTQISFIRDTGVDLGVFFFLWILLMLTASSNAVNLTDGLDGLASGASTLVFAAYVVVAFWQLRHPCSGGLGIPPGLPGSYEQGWQASLDTAIVAAAAMGACAGFLWWNAAPARIFMGDTGSLALGGLFAGLAVATRTELLLVILGGLFVLETTSVIIQVASFRLLHKRVFLMAPIHHHFELLGWPEFTVIVRFWIITGLMAGLGLGLFYADYITRSASHWVPRCWRP